MPIVTAYQDIPKPRIEGKLANGHTTWRSDFIKRPESMAQDTPMAFLAEASAGRLFLTHCHHVDQFQVMYKGSGTLGAHTMAFGAVHFTRAFTPYGPIRYGENGLGFMTLRAHRDAGQLRMHVPEDRAKLDSIPNRTPWQISTMPDFNLQPGESGVAMKAIENLKDERGLAGFSVVMKPGATAYSVDPSKGDGQHIVVLKGGIMHEGEFKPAPTVVWVGKDEGPFKLVAGSVGAEILILNFPVPGGGVPQLDKAPAAADARGDFKTYQCILCAFIYDEAEGLPDMGIAPGTRWADVPESFGCPDCEAKKVDFEMIEF